MSAFASALTVALLPDIRCLIADISNQKSDIRNLGKAGTT
jgi:hypothetical protein